MSKEKSFEEDLNDLEKIAQNLESGNLNLDEAIKEFEKGIKLSKKCNEKLEKAEKKINMLVEEDGSIREENFFSEE